MESFERLEEESSATEARAPSQILQNRAHRASYVDVIQILHFIMKI
jgi:hypothetical protein